MLPLCGLWAPYPRRGKFPGETDRKGRRPDSEEGPEGDVCIVPASWKGFVIDCLSCISGRTISAARLWENAQKYADKETGVRQPGYL